MNTSPCPCQDSTGHVCGKKLTKREREQDGMCSYCADNVWKELLNIRKKPYFWKHLNNKEPTQCV